MNRTRCPVCHTGEHDAPTQAYFLCGCPTHDGGRICCVHTGDVLEGLRARISELEAERAMMENQMKWDEVVIRCPICEQLSTLKKGDAVSCKFCSPPGAGSSWTAITFLALCVAKLQDEVPEAVKLQEPTPPVGQSCVDDFAQALESAADTMNLSPRDWSINRRDAWLYGIIVGWEEALPELAEKFCWDAYAVDRLSCLRAAFAGSSGEEVERLRAELLRANSSKFKLLRASKKRVAELEERNDDLDTQNTDIRDENDELTAEVERLSDALNTGELKTRANAELKLLKQKTRDLEAKLRMAHGELAVNERRVTELKRRDHAFLVQNTELRDEINDLKKGFGVLEAEMNQRHAVQDTELQGRIIGLESEKGKLRADLDECRDHLDRCQVRLEERDKDSAVQALLGRIVSLGAENSQLKRKLLESKSHADAAILAENKELWARVEELEAEE